MFLFCLFGCAENTQRSIDITTDNPARKANDLIPVFEDYEAVEYRDLISNPEKHFNKHVTMLANPLLTVDYTGILNPEEIEERRAFSKKWRQSRNISRPIETPKHWLPAICFSFHHNPDKIGRFHDSRAELICVWGRLTSYTEVYPGSIGYQRADKDHSNEDVVVTSGCKSRFVFEADTIVRIR